MIAFDNGCEYFMADKYVEFNSLSNVKLHLHHRGKSSKNPILIDIKQYVFTYIYIIGIYGVF